MISLGALEEELAKVLNTEIVKFCALSLEDDNKGEKIVLLIECQNEHFQGIIQAIKDSNIPALFKPSQYIQVKEIPLLGSGKVDFKRAKELAKHS